MLDAEKGAQSVRIHALLDDASRHIVAIEARHAECEVDMLEVFVGALRRHGAPDALYLDNGSTCRGQTLSLACARLGIALIHARPYDQLYLALRLAALELHVSGGHALPFVADDLFVDFDDPSRTGRTRSVGEAV